MSLGISAKEVVEQSESPLLSIAPTWERVCLGDVAIVQNGAPFESADFNRDGRGMPLIRIRDVGADDTETYFSGPYDESYVVSQTDILVGMDGDFRVARWLGRTALLNQRVCRLTIRSTELYDDRFLTFVLQPYLDEVQKRTSSITVKHLSSKTVAELPIPLPPIREQRRIVDELEGRFSHLDQAVDGLRSALRMVATLREATLWAAVLPGAAGNGTAPFGFLCCSVHRLGAPAGLAPVVTAGWSSPVSNWCVAWVDLTGTVV